MTNCCRRRLEVVEVLNTDKTLDAIYTDQDYMEADGSLAQNFYKPDWSPELFRGGCVGHFLVVRARSPNL